jgi:DNA-binding HxlR family transcriptional regulator
MAPSLGCIGSSGKGKSFVPVIAAIRDWGSRHLAQAGSGEMAAE